MGTSAIEWTDATWNPVTGCDRVSPGCAHCYALDLAARLKGMGQPRKHHRTLTGSRKHDPENQEWTECECFSCADARAALATPAEEGEGKRP